MPQALINVYSFLQDFNPSKFVVYSSLLLFSILFSLRLDNTISLSYWLIFLPLWIWKIIAFSGALVGTIIWYKNANYRVSNSSYIHYQSMLISVSLQLLLLMFEVLACDKLESKRHTWILAFVPLLFVSLLSISVCVWSVKNGRGIELEFFAAVNISQIIFIALKLDNLINWSWIVVFVPSWILLCFVIIVIIYAMITAIVLRSAGCGMEQRRAVHSASSSSMIFLLASMFIILLTSKLDSPPNVITPSYFVTCLPLFVTFILLIRLSFGSKSGSLWWFGMRTDFCTYLLSICPCLKEYGNTSFIMSGRLGDTVADSRNTTTDINGDSGGVTSSSHVDLGNAQFYDDAGATGFSETPDSNEIHPKGLLQTLSRVLFRDKGHCNDGQISNGSVAPKLSIDTPD